MAIRSSVLILVLTMLCGTAAAQMRGLPPIPQRSAAPLLHVRFVGAPGTKVTFYQGTTTGATYPAPVQVGLRPGYVYRMAASGIRGRPGLVVYPTLQVVGTLHLNPGLSTARFPVSIYLDEEDIEQVLNGTLITKVYYLEDPKKAFAEQGKQDRPFETVLPARDNLYEAAALRGRPMLVFRMGNRTFTPKEMAQSSLPGTILLPGQKTLPRPAYAPPLQWKKFRVYDPLAGQKPFTEECLIDGGDRGNPVGIRRNGELGGLDPEDTVAEYRDSKGRKRVAISNRVCVCVPRFAVIRTAYPLIQMSSIKKLNRTSLIHGPTLMQSKVPALTTLKYEQLMAYTGKRSVTEAQVLTQTSIFGRIDGLIQTTAFAQLEDVTGTCKKPPVTIEKPLLLKKWANKKSAQIGEIVTFYLRFSNQGGRVIRDVAVLDSLTGRLEYVPGSAKASRNAVFTMKANESGSLILRWEITGSLPPGQSGLLSFQARVR